MMAFMPDNDAIAREILQQLEDAWNEGSGTKFAAPFAADADFVDIRGDHHRGAAEIAAGHDGIFQSIYRGSHVRYTLMQARSLGDDVILVHSTGELDAPTGPLAGKNRATQSLVLVRDGGTWKIANFHNTLVPPQR